MLIGNAGSRGDGNMACNGLCGRVAVPYAHPPSCISSYSSQTVRASCAVIF